MQKIYDLARDGVTQSVLQGWLRCREYTRLTLVEGWSTIVPKPTFMFGDIVHGVLEHVYKDAKTYRKRGEPPTEMEISKYVADQIKVWKEDHGVVSEETLGHLSRNAAIAKVVLPHYFRKWFKKDFLETKWLGLEEEFEITINVNGFPLKVRGKRDGELEGPRLFETKTKSQIDEDALEDLLLFDFQTDLYSLSIKDRYGDYPKGVRYNIIRKPGLKQGKNEQLGAFLKRINAAIAKEPEHYFKRYNIYRPPSALKLYKEELIKILDEFIKWNQGKVANYRNTNSCSNKFGKCAMINICARGDFKAFKRRTKVFKELSYIRGEQ